MTVPPEALWRVLVQREFNARMAAVNARATTQAAKALRDWWALVRDVLREYAIAVARGQFPDPPPADLAGVLAGQAGYLAVGKVPETITGVVSRGQKPPGPTEERHIRLAVAYAKACGPAGITHNDICIKVKDRAPIARIQKWYGVARRTVYQWIRKFEPAFLGVNNVDAKILRSQVARAGSQYQRAGRSQVALNKRDAKNKAGASVRTKR